MKIDNRYLMPGVLVLSIIGPSIGYGHIYYFWLTIAFGFIGYFLHKGGFPVLSVAMALILGPIMEKSLRSSLMLPHSGVMLFIKRPFSLVFLTVAVFFLIFNLRRELKNRKSYA